jgi:uncharacterized membrane protein
VTRSPAEGVGVEPGSGVAEEPNRRLAPLGLAGAVTALVFWWLSLVRSQLPRSWWMQAVISAVIAAIDGLGIFAGWLARMAGHRLGYRPPACREGRVHASG